MVIIVSNRRGASQGWAGMGRVLGLKSLAVAWGLGLNSCETRYLHETDRCCEFEHVPAVATA